MGSSKSKSCNELAKLIWEYCTKFNIWITCAHIPGSENVIADFESRKTYIDAEWKLNPNIFSKAIEKLQFSPNIDCFATRINCQIDRYVSYKPDPYAFLINAFTFNWQPYNCYLFPPFSVIDQVLKKIQVDQAEALLVAPVWPTKPWFNTFQDLLIAKPYIVEPGPENLILPNHPGKKHPLWKKLRLMIGKLSGTNTSV